MNHTILAAGAISAALAVMLGAFGAHGLKNILDSEMLEIFETGVRYHFYHSLGLMIVGLLGRYFPESHLIQWSGWLMVAGIVIFSGSLYLLSISGTRWLGAITPVGGIAFIAAWILLAVAIIK